MRGQLYLPEETVEQVEAKRRRFAAWTNDPKRWATKVACDLFTAAFLLPKKGGIPANANSVTIPTTAHVRTRLSGGSLYGPLEVAAIDAADYARAFHWPLAFPEVMIARGGFDLVLGNPPWERIKLQEKEFFATRAPEIALAANAAARRKMIRELADAEPGSPRRLLYDQFEFAKRVAEASSAFFAAPKDEDPTKIDLNKVGRARRYPWTGRGDVNTYALFAEHFQNLMRDGGRAGLIVPTSIATDITTAPFFGNLVDKRELISLFSFYEVRKWFVATDDRKAFCLLVLGAAVDPVRFIFEVSDLQDLEISERYFELSPDQIAELNPNTKTAPVFRTQQDASLTATIYRRVPVLSEHRQGVAGNPWGVSFMAMFHMSNDSDLFRAASQLDGTGYIQNGADWLREDGERPSQGIMAVAGGRDVGELDLSIHAAPATDRYVPLYEAKMIHQFDHRWATYEGAESREMTLAEKANASIEGVPRYWVPQTEVTDRLSAAGWNQGWLMGWRRNARNTDERTMIFSALPRTGVGDSHFLLSLQATPAQSAAFIGCMNSLSQDFIVRQKAGGVNMSFYLVEQFPILPPSAYSTDDLDFIVPRVLELTYTSYSMTPFARDLGHFGPPFVWSEDRRAHLRADLDGWYALAYGLSRDELRYVLDPKEVMGSDYPSETFRVLKEKEISQCGEYRTARLVLAAYDRLVSEGMRPRTEGYR
ncbi:hypothetical protein ABIF79_011022 [Bradyrhizobium japonicum]